MIQSQLHVYFIYLFLRIVANTGFQMMARKCFCTNLFKIWKPMFLISFLVCSEIFYRYILYLNRFLKFSTFIWLIIEGPSNRDKTLAEVLNSRARQQYIHTYEVYNILIFPSNFRWCYLNKCNNNIYGQEPTKKEDMKHYELLMSYLS